MKKIIIALLLSNICLAQVAIEKTTVDGSGILDFALGTTKGIILPNVTDVTTMTNLTPGTLVYDLKTADVKYLDNVSWKTLNIFNLDGSKPGIAPLLLPGSDITTTLRGVVIGDPNTTAQGVLVLESSSQALILPKITDPVTNVKSPVAGMICYDPVKKIMALFNGRDWTFYK